MEPVSNGPRPGRRWALGAILALAGLWGAVAPFVITSGQSGKHGGAKQASERLAVNIAPGVAGALAGLILLTGVATAVTARGTEDRFETAQTAYSAAR